MLRILSECSASVRKSLQGLDYYAAEGTSAFEHLMLLVQKLKEWEIDMEWQTRTTDKSINVLLGNIKFKRVKIYVRNKYGSQLRAMCMMKKTSRVNLIARFSAPHFL